MATKTTGAEFKRWYTGPYWEGNGMWHEEEIITVNGGEVGELDSDLNSVEDTDVLTISGGIIYDDDAIPYDPENSKDFEKEFRKWRKQQNFVILLVQVPKSFEGELRDYLKTLKGKVL